MNLGACRYQHDVQQASVSGRWSAMLDSHTNECATCRDVRLIAEAFATAPPSARPSKTVDPVLLFARAREERRLRAEARASRVTTATQIVIGSVTAAAMLFFFPIAQLATVAQHAAASTLLTSANLGVAFAGLGSVLLALLILSRRTSQAA